MDNNNKTTQRTVEDSTSGRVYQIVDNQLTELTMNSRTRKYENLPVADVSALREYAKDNLERALFRVINDNSELFNLKPENVDFNELSKEKAKILTEKRLAQRAESEGQQNKYNDRKKFL